MIYAKDQSKDNHYVSVDTLFKSKKNSGMNSSLKIGAPNTRAEIEADQISEAIVRQNNLEMPQKPVIQTKASTGMEVEADLAQQINQLGGGSPLSNSERKYFESRFGADFSEVRIHTDQQAAGMARGINAKAFTKGNDIVFAKGEYQPGTQAGQNLMAHELTHVVQQTGQVQRKDDLANREHIIRVLTNRLIEDGLDNWHEGAVQGVDNFWKDITDQQISDLSQTSPMAVLLNIFGNLIWAATVFAPEAWPIMAVFGISTAGIGISVLPSIGSMLDNYKKVKDIKVKGIISQYMLTFINDFYQELVDKTRDGIENYAGSNSDVIIDKAVTSPRFKFFQNELYREPGVVDINKVSQFMYAKLMKLWNQAKYFSGVSVFDFRETPSLVSAIQNDRIQKEAEEKMANYIPKVLSYQSEHPGEGILFAINLYQRDRIYDGVVDNIVQIDKSVHAIHWYGGSKTREEAIKKYNNTTWISEAPPKGYYPKTYFHWIPPMGKL